MEAGVDRPRPWAALSLGALGPGEAQPGHTLMFVFLEKQMLDHPARPLQDSVSDLLLRTSGLGTPEYSSGQRAPCRVQAGSWGSMLSSALLLSQ